jgi:hypothetical protein
MNSTADPFWRYQNVERTFDPFNYSSSLDEDLDKLLSEVLFSSSPFRCTRRMCAVVKGLHLSESAQTAQMFSSSTCSALSRSQIVESDSDDYIVEEHLCCDPKEIFMDEDLSWTTSCSTLSNFSTSSSCDVFVDEDAEHQRQEPLPGLFDLLVGSFDDACVCPCHDLYGSDIMNIDVADICLECECHEQW